MADQWGGLAVFVAVDRYIHCELVIESLPRMPNKAFSKRSGKNDYAVLVNKSLVWMDGAELENFYNLTTEIPLKLIS